MKKSNRPVQTVKNKHPDYENLPAGIKVVLTEKEYSWLGGEERDRTIDRETQPDMDVIE